MVPSLFSVFMGTLWTAAAVNPQLDEPSALSADLKRDKGSRPPTVFVSPGLTGRKPNGGEPFEKQSTRMHSERQQWVRVAIPCRWDTVSLGSAGPALHGRSSSPSRRDAAQRWRLGPECRASPGGPPSARRGTGNPGPPEIRWPSGEAPIYGAGRRRSSPPGRTPSNSRRQASALARLRA